MPAREPKSTHFTTIQINGRTSERKGRLKLTSGNVYYYRKNAEEPAIQLTYQQLCDLLENEIAFRGLSTEPKLPKGGKSDFWFQAMSGGDTVLDEQQVIAFGQCPLSKMDPRRVDGGEYSLVSQNADRRNKKNSWYASISLPMVLSILNWYIEKWLVRSRRGSAKTTDVVITKPELRRLLPSGSRSLRPDFDNYGCVSRPVCCLFDGTFNGSAS